MNLEVGNAVLLHNINITLELGKIYGVLGSNGAGKTTMFKSMLGLTDFTGEILSDNQPVFQPFIWKSDLNIPAFYPKIDRRRKSTVTCKIFADQQSRY